MPVRFLDHKFNRKGPPGSTGRALRGIPNYSVITRLQKFSRIFAANKSLK